MRRKVHENDLSTMSSFPIPGSPRAGVSSRWGHMGTVQPTAYFHKVEVERSPALVVRQLLSQYSSSVTWLQQNAVAHKPGRAEASDPLQKQCASHCPRGIWHLTASVCGNGDGVTALEHFGSGNVQVGHAFLDLVPSRPGAAPRPPTARSAEVPRGSL